MKAIAEKNHKIKFRVSEEELRRIREIILEQYEKIKTTDTLKEEISVNLSNGSVITDLGFEDLFELNNEGSESIDSLEIEFNKSDKENDHQIKLLLKEEGYYPGVKYEISGERDWTFVSASMIDERLIKLKCTDLKSVFNFGSLFGYTISLGIISAIIYAVTISFLPPTKKSIENEIEKNQIEIGRIISTAEVKFPDSLVTPTLSQLLSVKLRGDLSAKEALIQYERVKEESKNIEIEFSKKRLNYSIRQIKANSKNQYDRVNKLQAEISELKSDLEFHSYRGNSSGIFLKLLKLLGFVVYPIFIITIFFVKKYSVSNGFLWGMNKEQFDSNQAVLKTYFIVVVLGIIVSIIGGIIANAL